MKARKYYSSESARGSNESIGFSNDTIVRVFESKKYRDQHVNDPDNISTHAILRSEVTTCAANWSMTDNCLIKPRPFSREFWGIVDRDYGAGYKPEGQIGVIEIVDGDSEPCLVDSFY